MIIEDIIENMNNNIRVYIKDMLMFFLSCYRCGYFTEGTNAREYL